MPRKRTAQENAYLEKLFKQWVGLTLELLSIPYVITPEDLNESIRVLWLRVKAEQVLGANNPINPLPKSEPLPVKPFKPYLVRNQDHE